MNQKRGVIFAPSTNTGGKGDAAEFKAQAIMLRDHIQSHGGVADLVIFNNAPSMGIRAQAVAKELTARHDLTFVAFLCHGWPDGIQAGFTRHNAAVLARLIHDACNPNVAEIVVLLDCCATGEDGIKATNDYKMPVGGDGGFADTLADELVKLSRRPTVPCHVGPGHTSKRPFVRIMHGGVGGSFAISPGDALWPKWTEALKGDLRWRYPWMSEAEIRAELTA